jgi:hypothetical protein
LDEVVIGYGMKRREVTGAASTVEKQDIGI